MTNPTRSPAAEVVEDYTNLAKDLIKRWSDYGAHVATNLDAGAYNADRATADVSGGVSLTIETGFKLAWEALDAFTILTGGLGRAYVLDSDVFTVDVGPATLELDGDLENSFGNCVIPAVNVHIIFLSCSNDETKFKLHMDATDYPAGTYTGEVRGTKPGKSKSVPVWITVP